MWGVTPPPPNPPPLPPLLPHLTRPPSSPSLSWWWTVCISVCFVCLLQKPRLKNTCRQLCQQSSTTQTHYPPKNKNNNNNSNNSNNPVTHIYTHTDSTFHPQPHNTHVCLPTLACSHVALHFHLFLLLLKDARNWYVYWSVFCCFRAMQSHGSFDWHRAGKNRQVSYSTSPPPPPPLTPFLSAPQLFPLFSCWSLL